MPAKTTTSKQSSEATNSQIMIPDANFNATGSKDKRLTMLPDQIKRFIIDCNKVRLPGDLKSELDSSQPALASDGKAAGAQQQIYYNGSKANVAQSSTTAGGAQP